MDLWSEGRRLLDVGFGGNTLGSWLAASCACVGTMALLFLLRASLRGRLGKLLARIPGPYDDVLVRSLIRTHGWFIATVGLYVGGHWITIPKASAHRLELAMLLLALLQVGLWLQSMLREGVVLWTPPQAVGAVGTAGAAFTFIGNLLIWSIVLLLGLQNLGIEIGALLAGLGVGGVAAALALQSVMGDLFASLSIFTDRPFDLGDFIIVGEFMGTVNKVGLRTTRLTSLGGEQIVLPNGDLMKSRIRNYRRMQERRVVNTLHVSFDTPFDTLRTVPVMLTEAIQGTPNVRFDRAHFAAFGEWSLQFELVYYIQSPEYGTYMNAQQSLNFEIMRRFQEARVSFAHPMRVLQMRGQEALPRTLGIESDARDARSSEL